jgi:hypothetical protein
MEMFEEVGGNEIERLRLCIDICGVNRREEAALMGRA